MHEVPGSGPRYGERRPAEAWSAIAEASTAFAVDLWARIRATKGNLAVSPASIYLALDMLRGGARGRTAGQIGSVLGIEDPARANLAAAELLQGWNAPAREEYELRLVSRLFGERSYRFEEEYLEQVRRVHGARLESVDFLNEPEVCRMAINRWAAEQTAHRIENLLPRGAVSALTRLIMANAICFLGKWASPFDEFLTRDGVFRGARGEIPVPMMHNVDTFHYGAFGDLKALEMLYEGDDLAMTILLPRASDGLPALEERISTANLARWHDDLRLDRVQVMIPRFEIDPPEPVRLKASLGQMGMPLAFDPAAADLSGFGRGPEPSERLCLDEVFHRAFVKTDESGTEAAAALAGALFAETLPRRIPPPPEEFIADHPFVFLIRDIRKGVLLFIGRVTDPGPEHPTPPRSRGGHPGG